MTPEPEKFVITVRAEGPGPPVPIRLRRLLKTMLRAYGVRCVSIRPETPDPNAFARDEPPMQKPATHGESL